MTARKILRVEEDPKKRGLLVTFGISYETIQDLLDKNSIFDGEAEQASLDLVKFLSELLAEVQDLCIGNHPLAKKEIIENLFGTKKP